MQVIVGVLVPLLTAATGFLLAAALASGAREDAYRAGYRAGPRPATLALGKIADTLAKPDREAPGREPVHLAVEKLRRRYGWQVAAVEGRPGTDWRGGRFAFGRGRSWCDDTHRRA